MIQAAICERGAEAELAQDVLDVSLHGALGDHRAEAMSRFDMPCAIMVAISASRAVSTRSAPREAPRR